jgi:hypothetical protein
VWSDEPGQSREITPDQLRGLVRRDHELPGTTTHEKPVACGSTEYCRPLSAASRHHQRSEAAVQSGEDDVQRP